MKVSFFWLTLITIIWIMSSEKVEKKDEVKNLIVTKTIKSEKPESFAKKLTSLAKMNLGKPYVYGKIGPDSFDCSGFLYGLHKQLGVILPRTSLGQSKINSSKISKNSLKEGDLVFFDTGNEGKVNHSGIYLGKGKFIHASSGKANSVTISSLDAWYKDKFKWGKRLNANK